MNDSDVMGYGYVFYDSVIIELCFCVVIMGVDDVMVVYIYIGKLGLNGDVFVVLE